MYHLPPSTSISKPLYKKALFEKFTLKTAERDRFDADVSRMALVARVSPATVPALKIGNEVDGFYVLQVALKRKAYDEKNILLLHKLIPQHMVFALEYEGGTQFAIFHTRLQQSEWMPTDDASIPLQGLTLDDVWNNIVAIIGHLDATAEQSLEQQIVNREQREKIAARIALLERQCRAEKQQRRKYELHQEIQKLKLDIKHI
jgi:hypothetical protein